VVGAKDGETVQVVGLGQRRGRKLAKVVMKRKKKVVSYG